MLGESTTPLLSPQDAAKWAAKELPTDGYAGHATWAAAAARIDVRLLSRTASLLAEDSAEALLDRTQTLALLRPLPQPGRSEFGWTLPGGEEPLAYGPLGDLLLRDAGLGWAKMPVWYDPKDTAWPTASPGLPSSLAFRGSSWWACSTSRPPSCERCFASKADLPVATVFAEPELWQPAVGPTMTRLSLKVHWWQLGDDNDVSFIGYPQLETKFAEIKSTSGTIWPADPSGNQLAVDLCRRPRPQTRARRGPTCPTASIRR